MEYIELDSNFINKDLGNNLYSSKDVNSSIFNVASNSNCELLIKEISDNSIIEINVKEDSIFKLSILTSKQFKNVKITANIHKNSQISVYFADFSTDENSGNIVVNLLENGANCSWHLASLSAKKDKKQFDVSVYHIAGHTFAQMDNYGVCKDTAKLVFSGVSSINKGSHGSKTHQNAKIMVFDENSNAIAKPILKIDENDIEASHAATVGKINDEHLFYLTSRGLTEAQAKELITFGYLKPILVGFNGEDDKQIINNLIEGRM